MTKAEIRMTKEGLMSKKPRVQDVMTKNVGCLASPLGPSSLEFRHSDFLRHSDFDIRDFPDAGSNPAVLTGNKRAEVQMGARLLWEQEQRWLFAASAAGGSTPGCPTWNGRAP
jgi:hypothetical protein